jgi:hypothetical protein
MSGVCTYVGGVARVIAQKSQRPQQRAPNRHLGNNEFGKLTNLALHPKGCAMWLPATTISNWILGGHGACNSRAT